jgi:hypothetical protein
LLEAAGYDATFEIVRARPQARTVVTSGPPGTPAIHVVLDDLSFGLRRPRAGLGITIDRSGPRSRSRPGSVSISAVSGRIAVPTTSRRRSWAGARRACVALGGDVRAAGAVPGGAPWPVPVEGPFDESRTMLVVPLQDAAVVTSTRLIHRWFRNGVEQHHVVDPATGRPARRGVAAVIVSAGEAWWAEILAKAALVAGVRSGVALLERHEVAGWVVDDEQRVWPTGRAARSDGPGAPR